MDLLAGQVDSGAEVLCIGDEICLYSEEIAGFVQATQTSSVQGELFVQPKQDRERPSVPDPSVISFQICVANRYKLNKKFRQLKERISNSVAENISLQAKLNQLENGAKAEDEDNAAEQNRQRGKPLVYGQVIQLQHVFSDKYIHVSTTQTSQTEFTNMQVLLSENNAKHAMFRIQPRFKVKAEGDMVQQGDQIVLESMKNLGQFLHISKVPLAAQSVYAGYHEFNLSVRASGLSIILRHRESKDESQAEFLVGNSVVHFFHRELEAYITVEGVFGEEIAEDVHFRVRPMNPKFPKTFFASTSAITYWQVEADGGPLDGSILKWQQQCRLRHMTTRKYLRIDGNNVGLTDSNSDPKSVFRLHPVIKEREEIEYESYCRVEHVVSGNWLHALSEDYKEKQAPDKNDKSMGSLRYTSAELKKIGVCKDMQYDDAFTLQKVAPGDLQNFRFMAGMVPFLQKIIQLKTAGTALLPKMATSVIQAMREMQEFMVNEGISHKKRQKLLRNLKIVELLVKIIQIPIKDSKDTNQTRVVTGCYEVLAAFLDGDSRKNELYCARHVSFFESQITAEGELGLSAVFMVTDLVRDNRKVLDRITTKQIDSFLALLRKHKYFRYLDLLAMLCVCDGVAIPDNQNYITKMWLQEGDKNAAYHTDLGQYINKEANIVYLSMDNKQTWIPLHEFIANKTDQSDEVEFFEHQLNLFGKLCYGRNEYAIKLIGTDMKYLSWKEAFACLTNKNLPDDLRAVYCHLIISLFVDVPPSHSVLDHAKLTYLYDEIDTTATDTHTQSGSGTEQTQEGFTKLRPWIDQFLAVNQEMVAASVGTNKLVKEVLRLVQYLIKYGFYGNASDIKCILEPLMSMIDGRNDLPYDKHMKSEDLEQLITEYQEEGRFKESHEGHVVVDAKFQAMKCLEMFFRFHNNDQLKNFLELFKTTYISTRNVTNTKPPLELLLHENFDIHSNSGVNSTALKLLKEVLQESEYFSELHITDILLDLANYEYDSMVVESLHILNQYFSGHDILFKRAKRANIVITEKSVEVFQDLEKIIPVMRQLTSSKMTGEQCKQMGEIMDKLILYCSLEDDPDEPHPMNQRILNNYEVMAIVLDIISQDIDVNLELYAGMKTIFRKGFLLLKGMTRGDKDMRETMFDHIDDMLAVKGAESEMALALQEIFIGSKSHCMKVTPEIIDSVMALVAKQTTKAPELLDLLSVMVTAGDELSLPVKRNQVYIMKSFMQHRTEVAAIIDQPKENRKKVWSSGDSPDLAYMLSLISLLATCAEGDNPLIDSICQTIFTAPELLQILNDTSMNNRLKKAFLRFFDEAYLDRSNNSGGFDISHDAEMWKFLNSLNDVLKQATDYAKKSPETVKHLLRIRANNKADLFPLNNPDKLNSIMGENQGKGNLKPHHDNLHYIFSAVLRFVEEFVKDIYEADPQKYAQEADHLDKLANTLMEFSGEVGPLVAHATQMQGIMECMNTVLTASTLPVSVMEEFENKHGYRALKQNYQSEAVKKYAEYYEHEEELNRSLEIFARNYCKIYGGFNTVRAQIGYNSDLEYTDLEGNEAMPLGPEFQNHIKCFIQFDKKEPKERYSHAMKLLQQLRISGQNSASRKEKKRLTQEELDIKCLQLLRGMIYNEIVKLDEDWEDNTSTSHVKYRLDKITSVQNVMASFDLMGAALPLLSRTGDDIVREMLALLAAMLFNGNNKVQKSMKKYFLGTREEKFFVAVRSRMQMSAVATKERRFLISQYEAKIRENVEQAKALRKAMRTGRMAAQEIMAANPMGSRILLRANSLHASRVSIPRGTDQPPSSHQHITVPVSSTDPGRLRSATNTRLRPKSSRINPMSNAATLAIPEVEETMANEVTLSTEQTAQLLAPKVPLLQHQKSFIRPDTTGATGGMVIPPIKTPALAKMASTKDIKAKSSQVIPLTEQPTLVVEDVDDDELEQAAIDTIGPLELEYKDDGYIELILKITALMCDGQYTTLQDYLREQLDNIKSVNLVAETSEFLGLLYSSINEHTVGLITQVFETLVEYCQGNLQNQSVVFGSKAVDYINFILRSKNYGKCSLEQEMTLKEVIGSLIIKLIEETVVLEKDDDGDVMSNKSSSLSLEVAQALDTESIWNIAKDVYHKIKPEDDPLPPALRKLDPEMQDVLKVGFNYFHILLRILDLDQTWTKEKLTKKEGELEIWEFYMESTMSVEILKNNALQRIYFWCKDKAALREEVMMQFNYEVDRDSPTSKLRGLIEWSHDIIDDIKYTRKIMSNPFTRFFATYWWHQNIAMIALSFVFLILVNAFWLAPVDADGNVMAQDPAPVFAYNPVLVQRVFWALGAVHNLLALSVLFSYFLIFRPKCPCTKRCCSKRSESDDDDEDDGEDSESNLEVKFFSFKTFWYLAMFASSILGTIFYGYFFALHLLHLAEFNELIKRAISAVTKNGRSLFWVCMYCLIIMWVYALIIFAFYRGIMDPTTGQYCSTMYECLLTAFLRGIMKGYFEGLEAPANYSFVDYIHKMVFDISHFMLITTIGFNIIFGIIVDTFSELRDDKWHVETDMKAYCFVCGRSSYDFEHYGGGFRNHIKNEHSQWAYIFFFIHLNETRPNDYTALELYVSRLLKTENIDFFPMNRALSLQSDDDTGDAKLQQLANQVQYIVNRMKREDIEKEKENELKRQQEWERKHRNDGKK